MHINKHISYSRLIQGFWRAKDWQWTDQQLNYYINTLVERGVTTMDHADIYGGYHCETLFGDALKLSPNLRKELQIITKCGIILPSTPYHESGHRYDHSAQHIRQSVERSLSNMNIEYLDSLLIHRPSPLMDPEEITETVKALVFEGKIKSFGVSNFGNEQFDLLNKRLMSEQLHITSNQLEISPYHLEAIDNGVLSHMLKDDVKIMAWSPLAGGKLFDEKDEKSQRIMKVISSLADKYDVSHTSIMIAWLNKLPAKIMPVLGTHRLERIDEAISGLNVELTQQEWFDVYTASLGYDIK